MLKNLLRLKCGNTLLPFYPSPLLESPGQLSCRVVTKHFASTGDHNEKATSEPSKKHTNPFARDAPQPTAQPVAKLVIDEVDLAAQRQTRNNPFVRNDSTEEYSPPEQLSAAQLSPEERERRLKVLQLEVDIGHQEGRRVPSLDFFQDHQWEHVLALPTKSARAKYYGYLWQIEMKRQAKERKKIERTEAVLQRKDEQRREREENTHIIYGLGHTSLFLRIYDSTINHWQNNRLTRAMQFAPKVVLDCSYDRYMTHREAINAAKQLMLCFAENRAHDEPFDMHYCNVNFNTTCIKGLNRFIPTMREPEFPMHLHEECFTEIFPKDNLVYLTPHCRTDLDVYNPDDVYIIGAMVDTVNNEPLSLAKAKKLGIRMARLPLDRYLQWGAGSGKSLTLNQMVNIMLDLKKTGDWAQSLKHVPRRKIFDATTEQARQKQTLGKLATRLNVRIDSLLDGDEDRQQRFEQRKVRSYKDQQHFDLATWGAKKKSRNSQ